MALNMRCASGQAASTSSLHTSLPSRQLFPGFRQQHSRPCPPNSSSSRSRRGGSHCARAGSNLEWVTPVSPVAAEPWQTLPKRDVLHANQFNRESLDTIFEEAIKMEKVSVV